MAMPQMSTSASGNPGHPSQSDPNPGLAPSDILPADLPG
ncbi:hypothetical protein ID866_13218 [Astraeus odoratus]|nr:hypothetical protein ID866_13218 [Astraeus odoratus]